MSGVSKAPSFTDNRRKKVMWLSGMEPKAFNSIHCFIALRFPITNSYKEPQQIFGQSQGSKEDSLCPLT